MKVSIKVPSPGESITEVEMAKWLVNDGDFIEKDQEIAEIDSDKATLTINAEEAGKINIKVEEGDTLKVGDEIATIDTGAKPREKDEKTTGSPQEKDNKSDDKKMPDEQVQDEKEAYQNQPEFIVTPQAKQTLEELNISQEEIFPDDKSKRITKKDILRAISNKMGKGPVSKNTDQSEFSSKSSFSREIREERMSMLRRKLSQRLVSVKNETAMLTTFNEIDMSAVMQLRKKYKSRFIEKHEVKLGFMSFFTKAASIALGEYPRVNAQIEQDKIKYFDYMDIGIAVSTPKGLMVPIIRNAESKSLSQIEKDIFEIAEKARNNKITPDDLKGGTFSITNGGVFGSMLSTPIINPPQSAILGMHNIVERPVAIEGKIEVRPIMYVALSYDHRIIDGRESVGFIMKIKEMIEDPSRMTFKGKDPNTMLLDL